MKKKDLIFYASATVLLAFSTQQVKADEQTSSDQTFEKTATIVLKAETSSNTENTGIHAERSVAIEKKADTEAYRNETAKNNAEFAEYVAEEKIETESPSSAVFTSLSSNRKEEHTSATTSGTIPTTEAKASGTLLIENNNPVAGTFDAVVRDIEAPNGLKEVLVPTWSLENGQDDLIWHKAMREPDGSYRAKIKASDHKDSTGNYRADAYVIDKKGRAQYLSQKIVAVDYARPSGALSIENNNTVAGTFDAVIRNIVAPNGVKEVLVPSWSLENGQDDLIWHKATKQSDGSYRVTIKATEHKGNKGNYRADAYVVDNSNNRHYIAEKVVAVDYIRPRGVLSIENNDTVAGTFDAVVRDIVAPNGVKDILVPSWSLAGGQDDLIWHKATRQADGSYRVTIKATDHKNSTGRYRADAYLVDNSNTPFYLTEKVVEVTQTRPTASLIIENNNAELGTFDAVVRNISAPNGIKEVLVPSWSLVNGQDDLIWHKATRQPDGSYRVTIKSDEHKNSLGNYRADLYIVDNKNQHHYITETVVDVKHNKPIGTISIVNNNKDTGTFDVIIKDVYSPKGVRTVQVPTWSDKDGQDDLRWYEATRQANGDYKVSVKVSDHKNSTGKYFVHLYYIQNDGTRVGVGGTTTDVEFRNAKTKTQAYIKNVNSGAGTYTVTVDQAPQGRQIKNIRVAAWSQAHQENLFWYTTAPSGTHTEVQVSAANHQYQKGNYTTHVYVDYVDGGVEGFNLGQTALSPRETVDQTAYNPHVSNGQRDRILRAAASLVGVRSGSTAHHQLVKDYNSVHPLPVGYTVKNSDDWCDVFVTTVFQREGLSHLIGRECGVERHIQIFKRLGIWNEDGASTPKAGDIITFNWDQNHQSNDGWADHIGIVESVRDGMIYTIEGNSGHDVGTVKRNVYRIGHGNIRGFATPRYY